MRTLSDWVKKLSKDSFTIDCPSMALRGFSDHESPILEGSGSLEIKGRESILFTMHALPGDGAEAFKKLAASANHPYDIKAQFRLFAIDYEQTEWACGWTSPQIKATTKNRWLLIGALSGLTTCLSGNRVSKISSAEIVLCPGPHVPLGETLIETASIGQEEIGKKISGGRHKCRVLGAEIEIEREPWTDNLWIVSTTSAELQHPFLENWLSEPLGVLCGEFVYPRLVARNFGDGRAFISLRPSPILPQKIPGYASRFLREGNFTDQFWDFYSRYLRYIAKSRSPNGSPNFETNTITRFYEEIMQAAQSSRWVLSLGLASAIEGIAKILAKPEEMVSDFSSQDLDAIQKHIKSWKGPPEVRQRFLFEVSHLRKRTIGSYLGKLIQEKVISQDHLNAWTDIRHEVMHGGLGIPWPNESRDEKIEKLLELLHILTEKLVNDWNQ